MCNQHMIFLVSQLKQINICAAMEPFLFHILYITTYTAQKLYYSSKPVFIGE
jgi:hypothetical protein